MFLAVIAATVVAPADLVVEHATLWSNGRTTKDAFIAVRGGRFVHVGKPDASLVGPATTTIDARGQVVLPGLIDSHTHLLGGGYKLEQLDLRPARSKAEFVRLVKERADQAPASSWIIGNSWSAESWPEKSQPTKDDLDPVTGDHPVVLYRMDGHSLIANSAALKKMGVTRDTPSPNGGSVDKSPTTGEPTGLLRETAMGLAGPAVPGPTPDQVYNGLKAAVRLANSCGLTAVSEITSTLSFGDYRRFATEGAPTLRFALYATTSDWTTQIAQIQAFKPVPGWVEPKGLKAYMDGSLGSRTAWMLAPYTKPLPDQKSLTGLPRPGFTDGTYERGIKEALETDLQVIVHAIGDRSNREILSMFERLVPDLASRRYRVEHTQHTSPEDVLRFGKLGVIASMQPYHKADDGRYCEEVIGTERSKSSYAYRQLLDSKAHLAFGSDWSVVSLNPWLGIETAVTGRILTGKTWMTHQNITLDEALQAYTTGGAYAMRMEKEIGQVAPGFRADFQILNASPFAASPAWDKIKPTALYIEGRRVSG